MPSLTFIGERIEMKECVKIKHRLKGDVNVYVSIADIKKLYEFCRSVIMQSDIQILVGPNNIPLDAYCKKRG